jgi:hypothetical protein
MRIFMLTTLITLSVLAGCQASAVEHRVGDEAPPPRPMEWPVDLYRGEEIAEGGALPTEELLSVRDIPPDAILIGLARVESVRADSLGMSLIELARHTVRSLGGDGAIVNGLRRYPAADGREAGDTCQLRVLRYRDGGASRGESESG